MISNLSVIGNPEYLISELRAYFAEVVTYSRAGDVYFDLMEKSTWGSFFKSYKENNVLVAAGVLYPKNIKNQTDDEITNSVNVNCLKIVQLCESLLAVNSRVRIVILGSESGEKGSFDTTYFLSKAGLSAYVRERSVGENQSLNIISPSTIEDSNMTLAREDTELLDRYRKNNPKKRFLRMEEVAHVVNFLFSDMSSYICNEEIRINGGKFARMCYKP